MTAEEIAGMSDDELSSLGKAVALESARRERMRSRIEKAAAARAQKRDPRCPWCHAVMARWGRRKDGVQTYRCPICHARRCDASGTSLASSMLPPRKMLEIVTLIMLDRPDWVVAWICRINVKTAQIWRDRCLDAAQAWSKETRLSGHVWMDEMRFAPTRATGLIDGVRATYGGRIARDTYMEVAFDSSGQGFCKVYGKLGMPTRDMVLACCEEHIEPTTFKEDGITILKGTTLTHDGALCHNLTIKTLRLIDDWHKFVRGDQSYEKAMLIMSNCCSYLRHGFESHRGIKYSKLEAYGDFSICKWCHIRKCGLRDSIGYLISRVCGTPKSHKFADMFSETSNWS